MPIHPIVPATALAMATAASAQVLTSDDFSYVGLLTDNGWVNHSGSAKFIMADGAVARLDQSDGSGEDVNRPFAPLGATDKIYGAFDMYVETADLSGLDANGLYFAHFKDSTTAFRGRTGIVVPDAGGDFGLAINADSSGLGDGARWADDLSFDTWYRVVFSWDAATGESELWLNPTVETDPKITHTGAATGTLIDSIALRQSNDYTGFQRIDNVIAGLSFESVVPAPSTALALGALGGLSMLRRRR
ncbi:MAG: PEP-CTERM sorting domain-containing protein [Phycisphaerales bacterium JB039]